MFSGAVRSIYLNCQIVFVFAAVHAHVSEATYTWFWEDMVLYVGLSGLIQISESFLASQISASQQVKAYWYNWCASDIIHLFFLLRSKLRHDTTFFWQNKHTELYISKYLSRKISQVRKSGQNGLLLYLQGSLPANRSLFSMQPLVLSNKSNKSSSLILFGAYSL
jgi:hypothetical protein